MNTPSSKSFEKTKTNRKFRRLFNSDKDIGGKLSCGHVHWRGYGSGYSKKDLPKDLNMQ